MVKIKCPYCHDMVRIGGCCTRHVRSKHPEKQKDYIERFVKKRGW